MTHKPKVDAVLFLSFGGPEKEADVMPFLRRVVQGRNVPDARLAEVAEHYMLFGGKSPINEQNKKLIAALKATMAEHGPKLPVYWGNRNWHPLLEDTLQRMKEDGIQHAVAFVTSAYSSYSGCRQYLENLEEACAKAGEGAPQISKLRVYYNHPLFIEALVQSHEPVLHAFREGHSNTKKAYAFTAHSLPVGMAAKCDYETQLKETASLLEHRLGIHDWHLVFQSRSGPPQLPWLEPDILEYLRAKAEQGVKHVFVSPIGFISDHMEVVYDLDHEAQQLAEELGIELVRAPTAASHPLFVEMICELIVDVVEGREGRALGQHGPRAWPCSPDCCPPR